MKTFRKILLADLLQLIEQAKDNLISLPPDVRLSGMRRPLTEGERLASAYLEASLQLLGITLVIVDYEVSDSESID